MSPATDPSVSNATGRMRWLLRRTPGPRYDEPIAERVLQQEFRVRRTRHPTPGVIVEEFETVWRDLPEVFQ